MRKIQTMALALLVVVACASACSAADEPKDQGAAANELVGTWKLVSAKYGGREAQFPEGTTMLKHMTRTHYMWVTYDKDGQVIRTAGGPYTFKGGVLESTPEYGAGAGL